jgi:hypothetical protein
MRDEVRVGLAVGVAGLLMMVGGGMGTMTTLSANGAGERVAESTVEASAVRLGPPIICHPYEIGDCETLVWGKSPLKGKRGYDRKKLVKQTIGFLAQQEAAIERMETIRRAAIYVDGDRELGLELLSRLSWRAMDAEAAGKPSAAAWFDAAFLVACFDEVGPHVIGQAGVSQGVAGYAWMERAIELGAKEGEIDAGLVLGAAMMVHPMMRQSRDGLYAVHMATALDAASRHSLEAKNIAAEIARWDETPASIRKAAKRYDAKHGD